MKKYYKKINLIAINFIFFGCAHTINIEPKQMPSKSEQVIAKSAAILITEEDRKLKAVTPGGGGDKVQYYPYRDLEAGLTQTLKLSFQNITQINSESELNQAKEKNIDYILKPKIFTSSGSESFFTWPPTDFTINFNLRVFDQANNEIGSVNAMGVGKAEFSEFISDKGLAGKRAAENMLKDLSDKLSKFQFSNIENSKK